MDYTCIGLVLSLDYSKELCTALSARIILALMKPLITLILGKGDHDDVQLILNPPYVVSHVTTTDNIKKSFKFGFEVPKNWKDILCIDEATRNSMWQDSIEKEVSTLIHHVCFGFKYPDYKLSGDYQSCRL